jgi:ABC-type antimicrobial peptide transport system permease subunit
VVNQKFVDTYLPGQNPLGRRFSNGSPLRPPIFEIVGVAANERFYDVRQEAEPMAYLAAWQAQGEAPYFGDLLIRTSADEASVVAAVRRALFAINKKLKVVNFTRLDHQVAESLAQQKLITDLSSVFGFVALLLAAIGIYGTVAYAVSRRTFEIGVRIALGAQRQNILAMILRESVMLTLVGLAVGLPLAFAATRWIKGFLFGVKAADPLAIAAAVALIALVSLLAAYIPAARATKTDPIYALRYE